MEVVISGWHQHQQHPHGEAAPAPGLPHLLLLLTSLPGLVVILTVALEQYLQLPLLCIV